MNSPLRRRIDAFVDTGSQYRTAASERLPEAAGPDLRNGDALRRLLERSLTAAAKAEARVGALKAEIKHLRTLSITDEATGLLNRRGFTRALSRAVERGRRYGETGALLLIDLDGFKAVNDAHGHAAGDQVLSYVARVLRKSVRRIDDVARIGGDEFAVLLNHTLPRHAEERAAVIEKYLNCLVTPWRGKNIHISASVGSHCFAAGAEASEVFDRADGDMYVKKRCAAPHAGPPAR